jgi:deazaflavin-dependent oxidoreductase (nitroreductase family)
MPEKVKEIARPSGATRFFFRLPIKFYDIGLGWIFGKRLLLLAHRGRKSGVEHQTVIEVVRFDRQTRTYFVASGWGEKSDWYQNVLANPQVKVVSGRDEMQAVARKLAPVEAAEELVDYSHRHPGAWRELASFMGYKLDGTEADIRALGAMIPMIAFEPAQ